MSPEALAKRNRLPEVGTKNRAVVAASHPGLVLMHYLAAHNPGSRRMVREAAQSAQKDVHPLYAEAFRRRNDWLQEIGAEAFPLTTASRLIIGLGSESPLETGLTLHHTYGVPIIPGSALKGLAAHYCDRAFGWVAGQSELRRSAELEENGEQKRRTGIHYRTLFGDTDDAGYIMFYDAWIYPESLTRDDEGLLLDVMTPHHSEYYGGKRYSGGANADEIIPPTDCDEPVPVQFLAVRGRFQLALSCDSSSDEGRLWLDWAKDVVTAALRDWGVGGKTSSGYGRLLPSDTPVAGPEAAGAPAVVPKQPVSALPAANDLVEVELTERRERAGGRVSWRAKHLNSGISGPIQNSEAVPADAQTGQRLQLYVAYANINEIALKYPSDEVKQQVERSKAKQQGGGAPRGGYRGKRP